MMNNADDKKIVTKSQPMKKISDAALVQQN
jgi:hypothetical protein